jgi:hypothetical protein
MYRFYNRKNTILRASELAKGSDLERLLFVCHRQKTISTRKLEEFLEELHESMKLDSIRFRALSDEIERLKSEKESGLWNQ